MIERGWKFQIGGMSWVTDRCTIAGRRCSNRDANWKPLHPMESESCGGFWWKQCKAMSRHDAMANADEAVPAMNARAEKMTKLATICTSSDAAPPKAAPVAGTSPPPVIARIAISRHLIWVLGTTAALLTLSLDMEYRRYCAYVFKEAYSSSNGPVLFVNGTNSPSPDHSHPSRHKICGHG